MEKLTIALDWTPNTNHAGIFLAQQRGLYAAAGLDLAIVSPEADNYATTPARKLLAGEADLAVASSETVLSYRTAAQPVPVTAVAALLQNDTSAIAVLAASGIERPAQLDGRVYASYAARFEDHIVREMVKNDGGAGDLHLTYPPKLAIWDHLLSGQAAATWIFLGWEGAQAQLNNISLRTFSLGQYGIPYGYTPIIVSTEAVIESKKPAIRKFLALTGTGYQAAATDGAQAARELAQTGQPAFADQSFVRASLALLQPHFLDEAGQWGKMKEENWRRFTEWLIRHELLQPNAYTDPAALFVNL